MMGSLYRGVQGLDGDTRVVTFSGLGYTTESSARAMFDKALTLYNYFNEKILSIPSVKAQQSWAPVLAADYKLLDMASQYLDQNEDTKAYDNSENALTSLKQIKTLFEMDLQGTPDDAMTAYVRQHGQELQSKVSEAERTAAVDGIFSYGGYVAGEAVSKAAGGLVKGAFRGAMSGGVWGIAGMALIGVGVFLLATRK